MMIPLGVVVVLAIVVPWYAALYHRYGWTYITSFFVGENIARYTEGVGVETRRGPLFYLPVVFSDSFPWSLCLFGAAGVWLADSAPARSRTVQPPDERSRHSAFGRCCGCGFSVIVGLLYVLRGEAGSLHFSRSFPRSPPSAGCSSRVETADGRLRGLDVARDARRSSACCSRLPAPGRSTSFSRGEGVCAGRRGVRRRRRRRLAVHVALGLALSQPRACSAGRRPLSLDHAELGIHHPRPAKLRALQTRSSADVPRSSSASLTEMWSRTTTSRCRAWCITSAATSTSSSTASVFLKLLTGDAACSRCSRRPITKQIGPRCRGADLRARSSADREYQTESRPCAGSVTGSAADHEPLCE